MPPLNNSDVSPGEPTPSHSLDSLSIEVELQLLLDRVTTMEAKFDRVLQRQDEILSRLTALENQSVYQQVDTPHSASFDESYFNQPPMYIPPPPLHPPPSLSLDAENKTPTREY